MKLCHPTMTQVLQGGHVFLCPPEMVADFGRAVPVRQTGMIDNNPQTVPVIPAKSPRE
jgi:hypothetical protein